MAGTSNSSLSTPDSRSGSVEIDTSNDLFPAALLRVKIDKDYIFEGADGKARLIDLFDGRRQLIMDAARAAFVNALQVTAVLSSAIVLAASVLSARILAKSETSEKEVNNDSKA